MFLTIKQMTRKGFTLVEILAATAIMVIIMVIVLGLTGGVLDAWNQSSARLSTNMEARVALDKMAEDMEAAVFRSNGKIWMEAWWDARASVVGNIELPEPVHLMFFSPVLDRPREENQGGTYVDVPGDICAVSYRLQLKDPFSNTTDTGFRAYTLYRAVIDPKATFESAMDKEIEPYEFWDTTAVGQVDMVDISDENRRNMVRPVDYSTYKENALATNVVDLRIVFWGKDSSGNPVQVTPDIGSPGYPPSPATRLGFTGRDMYEIPTSNVDTNNAYPAGGASPASTATLEYADIMITVLPEQAMDIIRAETNDTGEFSGGNDRFREIVNQEGRTFTRRVLFMNKPL